MARILVVDDNADLREVLRRALERAGHEVVLAIDGARGARAWRESGADLALVDIHMPDMDGIELLVQLRTFAPRLPVVMMSGGDQTQRLDLLQDAAMLGATGLLAKPFTLDELFGAVAGALAKGQAGTA
jgi:CheY-like chemotaxis protein